jgi:2'-5' RNA ligase
MVPAGNVALVSYISGPLAHFLDAVRLDLTPNARPHAHVTILPPRPMPEHVDRAIATIAEEEIRSPFLVELGEVKIFEGSNAVYLSLDGGAEESIDLHRALNRGILEYRTAYPYHPHVTLALGLDADAARRAIPVAQQRWADYSGPRGFWLDRISLVCQRAPEVWADVADFELRDFTGVAARSGRRTSTR